MPIYVIVSTIVLWWFSIWMSALTYMDPGASRLFRVPRDLARVLLVASIPFGPFVAVLWSWHIIDVALKALKGEEASDAQV